MAITEQPCSRSIPHVSHGWMDPEDPGPFYACPGIRPEREGREGESQALPTINDSPDIQSMVIADIEARRQVGIARYGTALQPNNGRRALLDLYEELMDAVMYLKQRLVEEDLAG